MTAAHSAPGQGPKLSVVESAPAGTSPGQRLARARNQQNMTIEAVARHLNMAVRMVRALEADNHKNLPGKAFVKGYLRNYAKLVALPPEEIIRLYDQQFGADEEPFPVLVKPYRHPARWIAPLLKGVVGLVVVGIVLTVFALMMQNAGVLFEKGREFVTSVVDGNAVDSEPLATGAQAETPEGGKAALNLPLPMQPIEQSSNNAPAEALSPTRATDSSANPPANVPVEGSPVPEALNPAPPVNPAPADPVLPPQAATVTSPVALAPAAGGAQPPEAIRSPDEDLLSRSPRMTSAAGSGTEAASVGLVFSGASWVRIQDAEQRVLFDGIKPAGSELQLEGKAPLSVRLGYTPGVKVTFNGEPYPVAMSGRSNVTQFILGAR